MDIFTHSKIRRMKTCKKCGDDFKTEVKIDGKLRNLCGRQFCLSCSPFGSKGRLVRSEFHQSKNGENVYEVVDGEKTKKCSSCNGQFNLDNFYKKVDGRPYGKCKPCHNKRNVSWDNKMKSFAVEYKGGKCIGCGYNKTLSALEFHHLNPDKKDFAISRRRGFKLDQIKPELDKCVLVCANCHAEIHGGVRNV